MGRAECLANWPEAVNGEYNPKCCRFPKSCSIPDNYLIFGNRPSVSGIEIQWCYMREDDEMDEEVTITVNRKDLTRVLSVVNVYADSPTRESATRIYEAIPKPPWEPTEDLIDAYIKMRNGNKDREREREIARGSLVQLHKYGIIN